MYFRNRQSQFFGNEKRDLSYFSSRIREFTIANNFWEAGLALVDKLVLDSSSTLFAVPHFGTKVCI